MRVREAIVVEGRYDKNTLAQVVDAVIIDVGGFGLFRDREKTALLRRLAETCGLLVLTDSDAAGFQIRNFIRSTVTTGRVLHGYIPDVPGKERRKAAPSKEGKLGVEGMDPETLRRVIRESGAEVDGESAGTPRVWLTKGDLYALGLTGGRDSAARRKALKRKLDLPERMSTNTLLEVVNALYTPEEFEETLRAL